jgi:hypothetical protein
MLTDKELLIVYDMGMSGFSDDYDKLSTEDKARIFELLKGGNKQNEI